MLTFDDFFAYIASKKLAFVSILMYIEPTETLYFGIYSALLSGWYNGTKYTWVCVSMDLRKGGGYMAQNKSYIISLQHKCKDIPRADLLKMANDIDPVIGELLYFSFMQQASFETVEKHEATKGNVIPASRMSFYRKRRRYIEKIEQRLAVAGRA